MSLLLSVAVVVFAAAALFVCARRFGLADLRSAALAAIGSGCVVLALFIAHGTQSAVAPQAALPAAPVQQFSPYPIANAATLARDAPAKGSLDVVALEPSNGGSFDGVAKTISARSGVVVTLQGWAVDPRRAHVGQGALAYVDGHPIVSGVYGGDRADVAQYLGVPDFRFSGYLVKVPTDGLAAGRHPLQLAMVSPDGKRYEPFGPQLTLIVTATR